MLIIRLIFIFLLFPSIEGVCLFDDPVCGCPCVKVYTDYDQTGTSATFCEEVDKSELLAEGLNNILESIEFECNGCPCKVNLYQTTLAQNLPAQEPVLYSKDGLRYNIDIGETNGVKRVSCMIVKFIRCESNPCQNEGTCIELTNSYSCNCLSGFTGPNCEENINDCESTPCLNGGLCVDAVNSYTCDCTDTGYEGDHCQTEINECQSEPCQNGGECINEINQYSCNCLPGFTGYNCEENINECESTPCLNGGLCVDAINSYTCDCTDTGYEGDHCQTEINECESTPCQYNGTCEDAFKSYICTCIAGITGANCQTNIDECESTPCLNGGTCEDLINGYVCHCPAKWTDTHCDLLTKVFEIAGEYADILDLDKLKDQASIAEVIADAVPFIISSMNDSVKQAASYQLEDSFEFCTYEGFPCDFKSSEDTLVFRHRTVFQRHRHIV